MIDRTTGFELGRRAVRLARTEQLTLLAAGVAYYAFVSLVPLMLLALGIAASIGGDALAMRVSAAASDVLTPSAQQLLADSIADETGQRNATIVGALGLLWGGSRVFRGLDRAFSEIYGTAASKSLLQTFWDAMIVALAITVGLIALGGLEVLVVLVPGLGLSVVGPVLVVLGLIVAFLPLYLIFPDADVGVREAVPGTILAAVGWFALARLFSLYAGVAGSYAFYGALGAVLLVLAWLYVAAILVIFGAVLNAVLAGRDADRQLQSPGPRQLSTEAMTDDATGTDDGVTGCDTGEEAATGAGGRVSARTADRAQDPEALREEIERLRDRLESFEEDVERRTVQKESLEAELKRYVRSRVRSGHAHGWGPYLVLLYGTAMAIAAFYFLSGGWAILAMFVVWTSTLGVYVLMVLFGAGLSVLGVPGRVRNMIGERRS
ncbi:YihY/virulence factor BrkB family protein [Natrononativus amylolyticus]|uniref:YihY/virulence factor BrkB family protein n=1 Tax=Natrononativus amylolyticus TaxID=2963434 RepID=UPI0020CDFCAB|nr:YhjD/YihY/BrkB family envelope integrity protein [Natrononativus amylolyticus]